MEPTIHDQNFHVGRKLDREQIAQSATVATVEWRWVVIYALLLIVFTGLPYLLGFILQGRGWQFSGGILGVEDVNSYLANMVSGSYGAWLFRTPYTVEPQSGSFFFLHYLWLGKLVSPPNLHLKVAILYHLFRSASILLVCLATYDFIAFFIPQLAFRRWGLMLATLGSGAGWLILVLRLQDWLATLPRSSIPGLNLPLEYYSPETFGFLALFAIPHVALARAGLLWGVRLYLTACAHLQKGRFPWWKGMQAGLVWLLTLLAQPLTGMLSGVVAGLFLAAYGIKNLFIRKKKYFPGWKPYFRVVGVTLWTGIFALPLVIYYFFVFQFDPVLRSWQVQSPLPSPHPILYLFAYGIFIPFAILGIRRQIHRTEWLLPISWVLAGILLAYAPFNMQRRLVDGVWVALIVMAIAGVRASEVLRQESLPKRELLFKGAGLLSLVSTLVLVVGATAAVLRPAPPVYHPAEQVSVMEELAATAQPGEVVLSAVSSGNVLPTYAPVRVVTGIGTLTTNFKAVEEQVRRVYSAHTPDQQRREILQNWHVDYIFWGPPERALGAWAPGQEVYLELLSQKGEYGLYRVDLETVP